MLSFTHGSNALLTKCLATWTDGFYRLLVAHLRQRRRCLASVDVDVDVAAGVGVGVGVGDDQALDAHDIYK